MKSLLMVLSIITPTVLCEYIRKSEAHEPLSAGYQSLDSDSVTWNLRKSTSLSSGADNNRYHLVPPKRDSSPGKQSDSSINQINEIRTRREAKSFRGTNPNYPWGHFFASVPHSGHPFSKYPKPDIDTFTGTQISKRPSIPWNPSGTRGNIGVALVG